MNVVLALIGLLILASAAVAMSLRNLIHSALLLIGTWFGIAGYYLWAGAEFIAFAEVLVYVGAVSMVVLFAVLLTRRSRADLAASGSARRRGAGMAAAHGGRRRLLAVLERAVIATPLATDAGGPPVRHRAAARPPELMGPHAAALLVIGLLLTVAPPRRGRPRAPAGDATEEPRP